MSGKVYLMGAGPGDPELLTVKAARVLAAADVILHDDLVGPEILALAPPHAHVENVGKRGGRKHFPQEQIHEKIVAYAREGKRVVRLKGGDPAIFGRVGEEIDALRSARIRFEVVPGVTAALGAAAAGQFPLTDRRLASSVLLVSGHECRNNAPIDWTAAVRTGATIVVYMPGDARRIAGLLLNAGMDPETPCAVIANASLPGEQTQVYPLRSLMQASPASKPNLLVVGDVVRGLAEWNSSFGNAESSANHDQIPAASRG